MFTFLLLLFAIPTITWLVGAIPSKYLFQSNKNLNESKIVKRFNKVLKSLKERNLDSVKEELIECLDEYSIVKEKQFSFTLAQIRKSSEEIDRQTNSMNSTRYDSKRKLEDFKSMHKGNTSENVINTAAQLLYKCKTNELILEKLQKAREDLKTRESDLYNMLADFNSNLAVKKAEIAIMVADSTGVFSGSTIDLRLDNLVKEFQDKVIEGKAAQDVHDKLNDKNSDSNVNFASCIEEAKNLLK